MDFIEDADGFRLPTAVEWEFATRGGDPYSLAWNYRYPGIDSDSNSSISDNKLDLIAWYSYNTNTGITGDADYTLDYSDIKGGNSYVSTHAEAAFAIN